MLTFLTSFLSSAGLRWLLGEAVGMLKAKQDRAAEIAMLRVQAELEAARADRQRQAVQDAAAAGVKMVEVQAAARYAEATDAMVLEALKQLDKPTGVVWVDGWNGAIRPALASASILLLIGNAMWPQHVVLVGIVGEVVAGALGLYVGGRIHATGR
jgi:hypothetical protein